MSDIVDLANDHVEREMGMRLRAHRTISLVPAGQCHYCAEPVKQALLFCDLECRDEYDREAGIRRRQGL